MKRDEVITGVVDLITAWHPGVKQPPIVYSDYQVNTLAQMLSSDRYRTEDLREAIRQLVGNKRGVRVPDPSINQIFDAVDSAAERREMSRAGPRSGKMRQIGDVLPEPMSFQMNLFRRIVRKYFGCVEVGNKELIALYTTDERFVRDQVRDEIAKMEFEGILPDGVVVRSRLDDQESSLFVIRKCVYEEVHGSYDPFADDGEEVAHEQASN